MLIFHHEVCSVSTNSALCELYHSTTIEERIHTGHMTGWECFDGQPDAELCEDWSGVKCDGQGHVKYLDISHQNLTGTLPPSIGNLQRLQHLYVDFNHLNGTLPDFFSKLTSLASLSLQGNSFDGTIPTSLGELSKLRSLHIDHNHLSGSIPSSFGGLPLNDLTASNNALTGSLPASLANIARKGRVVDFSYNQLSGDIPVELCLARNLFLIANNISNKCSEICHDKRYRDGRIHILTSNSGYGSKRAEEERQNAEEVAAQEAAELSRDEEEAERKELEDFRKNLRNMVNL